MKPQSGSLLVGRQVGNEDAGEHPSRSGLGSRFRHNVDNWRKLWTEVGDEVGLRFEVDGSTKPITETFATVGHIMMEFSVRRL